MSPEVSVKDLSGPYNEDTGGPERKEFELKPNFLFRLYWRTPRLPHAISASPRKRFIFISLGLGRQPLHEN